MKQVKFKLPLRTLAIAGGLFLSATAFAQSNAVKGQVTDASGEPIIGATITANGKAVGVTDLDGNYSVNVPKGTELTISYVGMAPQTIKAGEGNTITLRPDDKTLNEVVVIGYGRAKKSDLTGSVTAVKPDEMSHGLLTNAQDMIQGKIAGVNVISNDGMPGSGAQIRIRGGSSLNASNDPLIVIDGMAMDNYGVQGLSNPLSMVNPNDIESFTVLKDASATAIYGSRASNGVIIITTKKGKAGSKARVSYNGNISISAPRKTLDVLDGPAYTQFIKDLYGEDSEAYNALGYIDENGKKQYADTDWQKQVYRTAVSTDHNITVSGGLKNMPYRFSLGYTNQGGIVKTSQFERYTASVNLAPSLLNDHLHININGKGMWAKNHYANTDAISASRFMDPTKPVKYAGNSVYHNFFDDYAQWYAAASYEGDSKWLWMNNRNATSNPSSILHQRTDKAISKVFLGNIELDYAIHGFEDLHIHLNGAADLKTGDETKNFNPYSAISNYYGSHVCNTMDAYTLNFQAYAQYLKDFGGTKDLPVHHIDAMVGYEYQHFHEKTDWLSYGRYPSTSPKAGEYYNYLPASDGTNLYKTENFIVSYFGRLNYSLLDRYLFTFTLRDDISSRFPKGSRSGVFPSAAFAWRISEEPFLRDNKVINDFKLRLGWGITGQQEGIGDYTYIATYTPNSNNHALYPIVGDGTTYRPDAITNLTWEKTTTYNAGVDLSLWNDRLTFNVDWYYRKTKDLLNYTYVAAMSNFSNQVMLNIGDLHNTGIEFATTLRPVQTRDWKWELNYNFTYNKNKIDKLDAANSSDYYVETGGISAGTGGNIQAHAVGHPSYSFLVYQQVYDENGKPVPNAFVDRNGNGSIDSGDRYYYYKAAPDVTMGFGSKLQYKAWDLSFNMRASLGNYVYNNTLAGMLNTGSGAIYTLNYLQNRDARSIALNMTAPSTEQFFSDYFVQNASYLKMDNITLGYSFKNLWNYNNLNGRIYATVQNVFTITNYDGLDPEATSTDYSKVVPTVTNGIDNNPYPRPIQFILGLNLNF